MFTILLAQAPAPAPAGPGGSMLMIIPYLLMFVALYYVMIRPSMRRQKEQAKLVSSVKTGDRVVTASGIHGIISNVKDRTVIVKIADNVKVEMDKTAITSVANADAAAPAKTA